MFSHRPEMRIVTTGNVQITSSSPPVVVGTCSCCGGRVAVPSFFVVGETDTTPTCLDCGARKKEALHGPVIEMSPSRGKRLE